METEKKIELTNEENDVSEIEKKRIKNNRIFLLINSLILLLFYITI
ncbi:MULTISPECIES: hypothetical protein [Lysinibacillus]|nr:hypothetical protein JNUCC51_09425 [Lysinibacillus sp. JNUCC-51]